MPIQLNTPVAIPNYTDVRIAKVEIEHQRERKPGEIVPGHIKLWIAYCTKDIDGNLIEQDMLYLSNESGDIVLPVTDFENFVDADYVELAQKPCLEGETIADAISRITNNFLLEKGIFQGTIE